VTVMASGSAGAYHMDFIQAQFYYVLPVAVGTLVAFVIAGNLVHTSPAATAMIAGCVGLVVACGMLELFHRLAHRRK